MWTQLALRVRLQNVAIILYISWPRHGRIHIRYAVVTLTYWTRHIRWRNTTTTMKTFVLALCVFVAVANVNADLRSDLESAALSWVRNTYGRNNSIVKLDFTTTTVRGFYCVVNVCFVCEFLLFYVLKDHVLYLVTFKNRVPLMC